MQETPSGKQVGAGSLSLVLSIITIIYMHFTIKGKKVGEILVDLYHIPVPYYVIGLLLFMIAISIGIRFKTHKFSKVGLVISQLFIGMYLLFFVLGFIQQFFF
ncbi:hypothetical protein [Bacillus weihaiensis]|uniref:Uncharacterized protein n=1 Tax=Bacillus weihaiensis TaxID=1547283 RepID=A0A1L3MVI1_9BACI|nr:hypothetical protein [Bacillus weihaiensis]APH06348.1 hypothetical protein A9C19_17310 [Bacillus weihaiensis]